MSDINYTGREIYEEFQGIHDLIEKRKEQLETLQREIFPELNVLDKRIEAIEQILKYNELATPSEKWLEEEEKRDKAVTP